MRAINIDLPADSTKCLSKFDTLLNKQVFVFADTMPQFPCGMKAMFEFISLNLNYPREADCIEGTVLVKLVVELNGELTHKKIVNSFYEPASVEALRVINKMPNWISGSYKGTLVPMEVLILIRFRFRP